MKSLKAKLKKKGGFTLVEMLIVVAIIAILVMVSVPMMSSSLDKAKEAVDDANMRSAIGLGSIEYLTNSTQDFTTAVDYVYSLDGGNKEGKLVKGTTAPTTLYGQSGSHSYIKVTIQSPPTTEGDSIVKAIWINKT